MEGQQQQQPARFGQAYDEGKENMPPGGFRGGGGGGGFRGGAPRGYMRGGGGGGYGGGGYGGGAARNFGACYKCGGEGHMSKECPARGVPRGGGYGGGGGGWKTVGGNGITPGTLFAGPGAGVWDNSAGPGTGPGTGGPAAGPDAPTANNRVFRDAGIAMSKTVCAILERTSPPTLGDVSTWELPPMIRARSDIRLRPGTTSVLTWLLQIKQWAARIADYNPSHFTCPGCRNTYDKDRPAVYHTLCGHISCTDCKDVSVQRSGCLDCEFCMSRNNYTPNTTQPYHYLVAVPFTDSIDQIFSQQLGHEPQKTI